MITMSQIDFEAALEVAKQSGIDSMQKKYDALQIKYDYICSELDFAEAFIRSSEE